MNIIYFLLAFLATALGAVAGLGGGVIIKPVLDALGRDNLYTISLLSSFTVFSMASMALAKQVLSGYRFQRIHLILSVGAAVGGILGKELFGIVAEGMEPDLLKGVQAAIIIGLLIIALIRQKLPDWQIENNIISFIIGLFLGVSAAFLSIGGGPVNVAVLCIFLAISIRDAAVVSILIIFFSQGAKLITIAATTGFSDYTDLYKLFFMIPGGIAGGLLGSIFNRRLSHLTILRIYNVVLLVIIIVNIYNMINVFIL